MAPAKQNRGTHPKRVHWSSLAHDLDAIHIGEGNGFMSR